MDNRGYAEDTVDTMDTVDTEDTCVRVFLGSGATAGSGT